MRRRVKKGFWWRKENALDRERTPSDEGECGRTGLRVRVVIVPPVLPLPFGQTEARWLYLVVTELARRGVEVTCISSTEESEEAVERAAATAEQRGFEFVPVLFSTGEGLVRRKLSSLGRPFSER